MWEFRSTVSPDTRGLFLHRSHQVLVRKTGGRPGRAHGTDPCNFLQPLSCMRQSLELPWDWQETALFRVHAKNHYLWGRTDVTGAVVKGAPQGRVGNLPCSHHEPILSNKQRLSTLSRGRKLFQKHCCWGRSRSKSHRPLGEHQKTCLGPGSGNVQSWGPSPMGEEHPQENRNYQRQSLEQSWVTLPASTISLLHWVTTVAANCSLSWTLKEKKKISSPELQ